MKLGTHTRAALLAFGVVGKMAFVLHTTVQSFSGRTTVGILAPVVVLLAFCAVTSARKTATRVAYYAIGFTAALTLWTDLTVLAAMVSEPPARGWVVPFVLVMLGTIPTAMILRECIAHLYPQKFDAKDPDDPDAAPPVPPLRTDSDSNETEDSNTGWARIWNGVDITGVGFVLMAVLCGAMVIALVGLALWGAVPVSDILLWLSFVLLFTLGALAGVVLHVYRWRALVAPPAGVEAYGSVPKWLGVLAFGFCASATVALVTAAWLDPYARMIDRVLACIIALTFVPPAAVMAQWLGWMPARHSSFWIAREGLVEHHPMGLTLYAWENLNGVLLTELWEHPVLLVYLISSAASVDTIHWRPGIDLARQHAWYSRRRRNMRWMRRWLVADVPVWSWQTELPLRTLRDQLRKGLMDPDSRAQWPSMEEWKTRWFPRHAAGPYR
jgi:hypothetical protein